MGTYFFLQIVMIVALMTFISTSFTSPRHPLWSSSSSPHSIFSSTSSITSPLSTNPYYHSTYHYFFPQKSDIPIEKGRSYQMIDMVNYQCMPPNDTGIRSLEKLYAPVVSLKSSVSTKIGAPKMNQPVERKTSLSLLDSYSLSCVPHFLHLRSDGKIILYQGLSL